MQSPSVTLTVSRIDVYVTSTLKSLFYLISQFTKSVANPLKMIAVNFEAVLLNGAAAPHCDLRRL